MINYDTSNICDEILVAQKKSSSALPITMGIIAIFSIVVILALRAKRNKKEKEN